MNIATRQTFFRFYAIFFILITPFIVIYSLGYNFDWQNQTLSKNLFLKIQTLPRGADVEIQNAKKYTTPTEIRLSTDSPKKISISKDGYLDENFTVWSDLDKNTNTYLDKIILLPTNASSIQEFASSVDFLTFLPESRALFYSDNNVFMHSYSTNSVSAPISVTTDLNPEDITNEDKWVFEGQDFFWNEDKKFALYKDSVSLRWNLEDLSNTILGIDDIARVSNNTFLALDQDNNLYTYRPQDERVSFLDSGFLGIYANHQSESVWLAKEDNIIRLNKNRVNYDNILDSDENFIYSTTGGLVGEDSTFEVADIYRGVVVRLGSSLYFLEDTEPNISNLLTNEAVDFTTSNNTVFWMHQEGYVQMYNFEFDVQKNLANFDGVSDKARLYYSGDLGRLVVYDQNVNTIWVNPANKSDNIKEHSKNTWLSNPQCQKFTEGKNQVCFEGGSIVKYQNSARF